MRAAVAVALFVGFAGCGDHLIELDASLPTDGGGEFGPVPDGGGPLAAAFTVSGCATLDLATGAPVCTGQAPLALTFVPIGSGVTSFLWSFPGGDPSSSKAISPSVTFDRPGNYAVTLAAGGPAGTTSAGGTVVVMPGGIGAGCGDPTDCDPAESLGCVCGSGSCPGALAVGLCTRDCAGGECGAAVCADLTRGWSGALDDMGAPTDAGSLGDDWRRSLCLPSCAGATDCRVGFSCREVPVLASGATSGGAYAWVKACFGDQPGDVGASCFDANGQPEDDRCLSGRCDALGARGLCTADCSTVTCPSYASCVQFAGAAQPQCLVRCDPMHACSDPLFDCEAPGKPGAFGFTVSSSDPAGTTYCAPKHCTQPSDCAPSGNCASVGGGSFCVKN